jgi:TonB family protein
MRNFWLAQGGVAMVAVALGLLTLGGMTAGCGGGATEVVRHRPRPARRMVARVEIPPPPRQREVEVHAGPMRVAGITGSLTPYEVREALEERGADLGACFMRQSRRLRGLGGRMEIAFHVDGQGRVEWARTIDSTIGHRQVERCVLSVASRTQFPRPHGGGAADFTWPLEMEPPDGVSEPLTWDPSRVEGVVRRNGARVLEECVAPGGVRPAFQVTTYVSRSGRVIAAGAVAMARDGGGEESLDCVAGAVRRWRMPRSTRAAKVTFELRADSRIARR